MIHNLHVGVVKRLIELNCEAVHAEAHVDHDASLEWFAGTLQL